ncbi:hypothetical protein AAF712_002570 [Marasmius tenuissimus]|uniref:Uncharacterized protein n=1 Tax=Marasmius tenuissimus TaxID=585030 RepID=A0ABR3AAJ4_9AGAR
MGILMTPSIILTSDANHTSPSLLSIESNNPDREAGSCSVLDPPLYSKFEKDLLEQDNLLDQPIHSSPLAASLPLMLSPILTGNTTDSEPIALPTLPEPSEPQSASGLPFNTPTTLPEHLISNTLPELFGPPRQPSTPIASSPTSLPEPTTPPSCSITHSAVTFTVSSQQREDLIHSPLVARGISIIPPSSEFSLLPTIPTHRSPAGLNMTNENDVILDGEMALSSQHPDLLLAEENIAHVREARRWGGTLQVVYIHDSDSEVEQVGSTCNRVNPRSGTQRDDSYDSDEEMALASTPWVTLDDGGNDGGRGGAAVDTRNASFSTNEDRAVRKTNIINHSDVEGDRTMASASWVTLDTDASDSNRGDSEVETKDHSTSATTETDNVETSLEDGSGRGLQGNGAPASEGVFVSQGRYLEREQGDNAESSDDEESSDSEGSSDIEESGDDEKRCDDDKSSDHEESELDFPRMEGVYGEVRIGGVSDAGNDEVQHSRNVNVGSSGYDDSPIDKAHHHSRARVDVDHEMDSYADSEGMDNNSQYAEMEVDVGANPSRPDIDTSRRTCNEPAQDDSLAEMEADQELGPTKANVGTSTLPLYADDSDDVAKPLPSSSRKSKNGPNHPAPTRSSDKPPPKPPHHPQKPSQAPQTKINENPGPSPSREDKSQPGPATASLGEERDDMQLLQHLLEMVGQVENHSKASNTYSPLTSS